MNDEWVMHQQSRVFSRIKNEFSEKLKKKYNMTSSNFSTVGSSDTPAVFPFVCVEEIESQEIGRDLEGTNTNGLGYGVRIHISDNKSQTDAFRIAHEVRRVMKTMRFSCSTPIPQSVVNNVHSYVLQCTEGIGDEDIL